MIPIVDAHHHIWRQADLPWLVGPMQPRIFGPYEPIRRDYSIDEYRADLAGVGRRQVGLCADQLAARAVRGRGRLGADDRRRRPAGRMRSSPMPISPSPTCARSSTGSRATRWCAACACSCTGTRTRSIASPRAPISRADPVDPPQRRAVSPITAGASISRCSRRRWPDAADLAEACPKVTFVLQHAGMLEDLSPAGPRGLARRHGAAGGMSERRLQAFGARHVPSPQRSRAYRRDRARDAWRSSAPSAACSARTFRSRSSGPSYRALVDAYRDAASSLPAAEQRGDPARHGDAGLPHSRHKPAREHEQRQGEDKHAAGNQDSRLWRHRTGIRAFSCSGATAAARAAC